MELKIEVIAVGNWSVNCYLVAFGDEAWIIDPGDDVDKIVQNFELDNFNLKGIVTTHGHFDHIGAIAELKAKYNTPFYLHSKDKRLVSQSNLYRRMASDLTISKTPIIDSYLDDIGYLELQRYKILIHHTPGHTEGGICFEIQGNLFTGDLLFYNTVGRTDLPGGNKISMLRSVEYLYENFEGFRVHPGHGKSFVLDRDLITKLKETIN